MNAPDADDGHRLPWPEGLSRRTSRASAPRAAANVIRIAACGICASDCKCWSGAKMFWGGERPRG